VDVHAEDQLATRDVLELVDEVAVAVARRDPLPLEEAERVCARRADAEALLACDRGHVRPQLQELALHVAGVAADGRRDLEHRLHQLRIDPWLELVAGDRLQHGVDVLDEVEGLAVEQHVLLLDAERVRVGVAELVLEDAPTLNDALAGDRVRVDLLHVGRTASASISTSQRGSSRPLTTMAVEAGRISENTSPCARATSS
jgi:hypothetical protein